MSVCIYAGFYHLKGEVRKVGFALRVLKDIVEACGLHTVRSITNVFPANPYPALSVVTILKESHVALHTYPGDGVVLLTFSLCRPVDVTVIENLLNRNGLIVERIKWIEV